MAQEPQMAAPVEQHVAPVAAPASLINPHDVDDWKSRFNEVLADTSKITAPGPTDAKSWTNAFFGCFSPIDLCLVTWCLPCVSPPLHSPPTERVTNPISQVTFGKTHHRTRKSAAMTGYEPINTSCLLLCGTGCIGVHWIPMALQRSDIRKKYGLEGNCLTDIAMSCCCALCSLTQAEKETLHLEEEAAAHGGKAQYDNGGDRMEYKN